MRARFCLLAWFLLSWWLPVPHLRAQGRLLGPWQIVNKKVRTADDDGWRVSKDTITHIVVEARLAPVRWDVGPDSIRLFLNCENPFIAPDKPRDGKLPVRFTSIGATVRVDEQRQSVVHIAVKLR